MELQRGQVVRSLAGHDQGDFQVVVAAAPPYAFVCDGKRRPLQRPKRKKQFHWPPRAPSFRKKPCGLIDRYALPCAPFGSGRGICEARRLSLCQNRT